jgi:hypothetical protein
VKTLARILLGLTVACLMLLGAAPAFAGFTPKCRAGAKAGKPTKTAKTKTTKKYPTAANKSSGKKKSDGGDKDDGDIVPIDDGGQGDDGDVVTLFDVSEQ